MSRVLENYLPPKHWWFSGCKLARGMMDTLPSTAMAQFEPDPKNCEHWIAQTLFQQKPSNIAVKWRFQPETSSASFNLNSIETPSWMWNKTPKLVGQNYRMGNPVTSLIPIGSWHRNILWAWRCQHVSTLQFNSPDLEPYELQWANTNENP